MFADSAKIYIRSGKGGDGHVSFRREIFVPAGGPNGGDGGRGGDIIFEVDEGLNTLVDFRMKRKYCAQDGDNGQKSNCTGKDGEDLIIKATKTVVAMNTKSYSYTDSIAVVFSSLLLSKSCLVIIKLKCSL